MNVFFRFIPSEHTQTSSSIWPYLNLGNSPPNWSSFILFPSWFIVPARGCIEASQVARVLKKPPANAGDRHGFDPWVRKISCGGGHGSHLKYSCLKNPMDRGAWWATVHGVAKCRTRLTQLLKIIYLIRAKTYPFFSFPRLFSSYSGELPCFGNICFWDSSFLSLYLSFKACISTTVFLGLHLGL